MRYLSVYSGIEAASVAWHDFGWTPVGFAEIDNGPSKVLAHHYGSNMPGEPLASNGVPNFGDFTQIPLETLGRVDLLVGGTPCQAFSVAGKRLSLDDARGNLTLAYVVLAHELARSHGLRTALWENVPGVLSTKDNAFGCFLGALSGGDDPLRLPKGIERWPDAGLVAGPRARVAWRLLDAQYFGLAQRRRRVFVVASFGDGPDPAEILFERAGVRRHPPARGQARENLAPTISARTRGGGGLGTDAELDGALIAADAPAPMAWGGNNCGGPIEVATACNAHGGPAGRLDFESETFVTQPHAFDASEDGTGRGTPIVPCEPQAFYSTESRCDNLPAAGLAPPLKVGSNSGGQPPAVAFSCKDHGADATSELAPTMRAMGHAGSHANAGGQLAVAQPYTLAIRGRGDSHNLEYRQDGTANALLTPNGGRAGIGVGAISHHMAVRRLTPVECERLQGFPDGWTECLKSDGPRYKSLGNSMAVNVMRWIGERIGAGMERT